MEEIMARLRWQIRYLKRRLDEIEAERWRVAAGETEPTPPTYESVQLCLRDLALRAESAAVQAELTALELRVAHLTVAAEVERLSRVPAQSVSVQALRVRRDQLEEVPTQHRKNARKMIRDATDDELSFARSEGKDVAPIRAARRKKRTAAQTLPVAPPQAKAQAPVKRSRGLHL